MERLDAIVFTGGVGEHSAYVRAESARGLGRIGLVLDAGKNAAARADTDIAASDSPVRALVTHAREEWMIAGEAAVFI